MNPKLVEENSIQTIEGLPEEALMRSVQDVDRVIEACFSEGVRSAVLYAPNMSPSFFDLSSGEAGEILQKLRNYQIRLAVVCPPGTVTFSSRFREMVDDEQRGSHFGIFETRQAAFDWLRQHAA